MPAREARDGAEVVVGRVASSVVVVVGTFVLLQTAGPVVAPVAGVGVDCHPGSGVVLRQRAGRVPGHCRCRCSFISSFSRRRRRRCRGRGRDELRELDGQCRRPRLERQLQRRRRLDVLALLLDTHVDLGAVALGAAQGASHGVRRRILIGERRLVSMKGENDEILTLEFDENFTLFFSKLLSLLLL